MYWFCECQSSTTGGRMSPNEIVWGRAVSCLHNQANPIEYTIGSCDGIHWHQVQWHYYVYWFCECPELENWGRNGLQMNVWGRAVSCLHNQAPNWNQLAPCDGIHWHQVQWHSYMYWFCECQSSTTGGRMVSNELCEGEHLMLYIIKHPIETHWLLHGIHWHQVQWHSTCIDSVSARAGELGTDGLQMNCVRESSLMAYIIKHPIETPIGSLWWNTPDIRSVTFLHVLIVSARAAQLERRSPNELC